MSTGTTQDYPQDLTTVLSWFPNNVNNNITALDVRNMINVLWHWLEDVESNTISYNNNLPTTISVGGINKGENFNNQTFSEIFERLFYPTVTPTISLEIINYPTTNSVNVRYSLTKGSGTLESLSFTNGGVTTSGNITQDDIQSNIITINLDNPKSNTIISTLISDVGTTTENLTIDINYKQYYYGSYVINNSNYNRVEDLVDLSTSDLSSIVNNIVASDITSLQSELRNKAIGFNKSTTNVNNQNLLIAYPQSGNSNTSIHLNGIKSNSFNISNIAINGEQYVVLLSNTKISDTFDIEFK